MSRGQTAIGTCRIAGRHKADGKPDPGEPEVFGHVADKAPASVQICAEVLGPIVSNMRLGLFAATYLRMLASFLSRVGGNDRAKLLR
jgi:hypothetical protein